MIYSLFDYKTCPIDTTDRFSFFSILLLKRSLPNTRTLFVASRNINESAHIGSDSGDDIVLNEFTGFSLASKAQNIVWAVRTGMNVAHSY